MSAHNIGVQQKNSLMNICISKMTDKLTVVPIQG